MSTIYTIYTWEREQRLGLWGERDQLDLSPVILDGVLFLMLFMLLQWMRIFSAIMKRSMVSISLPFLKWSYYYAVNEF